MAPEERALHETQVSLECQKRQLELRHQAETAQKLYMAAEEEFQVLAKDASSDYRKSLHAANKDLRVALDAAARGEVKVLTRSLRAPRTATSGRADMRLAQRARLREGSRTPSAPGHGKGTWGSRPTPPWRSRMPTGLDR